MDPKVQIDTSYMADDCLTGVAKVFGERFSILAVQDSDSKKWTIKVGAGDDVVTKDVDAANSGYLLAEITSAFGEFMRAAYTSAEKELTQRKKKLDAAFAGMSPAPTH